MTVRMAFYMIVNNQSRNSLKYITKLNLQRSRVIINYPIVRESWGNLIKIPFGWDGWGFPTVIFWADIFPHFSFLRLKCLFVIIFVPINFLVNFLTSYDYFGSVSNQFCCGGIFVHAICFQTSYPTYSRAAGWVWILVLSVSERT